jgi:hypothetical protein
MSKQSRKQSSSDPLPYVQVDRAVKPKATLLANLLGVTPQHAIGSLVEFWELCGDPRELEAIVEAAGADGEPEVALTAADLQLRFHLASGKHVDPNTLASLGLVEARADRTFRVRGMSRYFEPIRRRLQARAAASKGGKASVATRRRKDGSAQPVGGKGSEVRSDARSAAAQAGAQAASEVEPKRNPKRDGSATEAEPKPSGQRSAVSGQLLEEEALARPPTPPPENGSPRMLIVEGDLRNGEAFFAWAQGRRAEVLDVVRERASVAGDVDAWFSEAARAVSGDLARLMAGYERFLADQHWRPKGAPWPGWLAQWEGFVPPRARAAPERVDAEAFREVASLVNEHFEQPGYALSQLAELTWSRHGEKLIGESDDQFSIAFLSERFAAPRLEYRTRGAT